MVGKAVEGQSQDGWSAAGGAGRMGWGGVGCHPKSGGEGHPFSLFSLHQLNNQCGGEHPSLPNALQKYKRGGQCARAAPRTLLPAKRLACVPRCRTWRQVLKRSDAVTCGTACASGPIDGAARTCPGAPSRSARAAPSKTGQQMTRDGRGNPATELNERSGRCIQLLSGCEWKARGQ